MTDKENKTIDFTGGISLLANAYGPYAFGVLSLLIVWFSIVKPELNSRALDFASQMEIVEAQRNNIDGMRSIASTMESTADSIRITATILEKTVTQLK